MQRGVQVTQAFRNEIGKAVKTKRLTTGRTQKAFALEVGTTATTLRNIEMGLSLVSAPLLKKIVEAVGIPFNPSLMDRHTRHKRISQTTGHNRRIEARCIRDNSRVKCDIFRDNKRV